jgi:hypothetical protein
MPEFNYERGREAGVKWGERLERERIIKLLEVTYDSEHFVGLNMHEVIALIKGENK